MDYLPIFVDLRDRLVVVVGGGVVAFRKVEHLLKSQARVRIVSPDLHADLARLRDAGRLLHDATVFTPLSLDGAALVIAATDVEAVNEAVSQAARARGIWVNVVDDVARSQFIFPAIVDRSPLIIAVGTAGSSPSLARRVRTQIETLLPERLGQLAQFAGRWRHAAKAAFPDLPARLRFWDRFFASPLAAQLLAGQAVEADASMQAALDASRLAGDAGQGEVYLIGVGPGDPDLLTVRALQLLQQADVLLYDRLVPEVIVDRARRDAEKVNVGKQPGRHDVPQAEINALLLEYARKGLRVARVKGGDPFVFGRGGEELQVLRDAGIPAIVVPGITAALGAAAASGIPLTQRGLSQSVTFVTATGKQGSDLNWPALAYPSQTVVFYMSAAQLDYIAGQLQAHGLAADHPAALIERATWPDQRVLRATVGELPALGRSAGLKSPTLLVVGHVTALAELQPDLGQWAGAPDLARAGEEQ